MFGWLTERGYGSGREIMRRYTLEQVELLYYISRKNHFKSLQQEIEWQANATAGKMGQAFAHIFG